MKHGTMGVLKEDHSYGNPLYDKPNLKLDAIHYYPDHQDLWVARGCAKILASDTAHTNKVAERLPESGDILAQGSV